MTKRGLEILGIFFLLGKPLFHHERNLTLGLIIIIIIIHLMFEILREAQLVC